jgi:hypothetical protein
MGRSSHLLTRKNVPKLGSHPIFIGPLQMKCRRHQRCVRDCEQEQADLINFKEIACIKFVATD